MKPLVTMREALGDPALLGGAIPGESWALWRVLLIASMGERLTDDERPLFTAVTGRDVEPLERVDELWCVVGRRAGKTRAAAVLAGYCAALCDWSEYLAPGERGVLPIMAAAASQASRAFQHVAGILEHSPVLSGMIDGDPTADTIKLSTRVDIEIKPASFRTVRSITAVGCIADELAFWHIEGSRNPDREILNAVRPALATTRAPLMVISSPYAKRGELYRTFRSDYGADGDPIILVAKGPSRAFNPTLDAAVVEKAYARDAAAAMAEYGGEFRSDVEQAFPREVVEDCVAEGVTFRPRLPGIRYRAFVDPSGGSADSMTMAICHSEGDRAVLDCTREVRPPFSPDAVVVGFAAVLASYGVSEATGDRYAGEWCREVFRRHGITYRVAEKTRSELFLALLPPMNSGRVVLLDDRRLVDQLAALERRTSRSGRDSIDHAPGGHDDLANAVAGAIDLAVGRRPVANAAQLVGSRSAFANSNRLAGVSYG